MKLRPSALTAKQRKIASLGGNKNKIDAADFKKLRKGKKKNGKKK